MMSPKDRREFKMYCRNASDRQLWGILEKEQGLAKTGDSVYHNECADMCSEEIDRRGLRG